MTTLRRTLVATCLLGLGAAAAGCQSGPTPTEVLAPDQGPVSIRRIQARMQIAAHNKNLIAETEADDDSAAADLLRR